MDSEREQMRALWNARVAEGKGRYRLDTILGEGGMASVWLAWDTRLRTKRAIKIASPEVVKHREASGRFLIEARTMADLHHPHIVTVHDVDEFEGRPFMVMEWLDGGTFLSHLAAFGRMPARQAVEVIVQMLDALKLAHGKGIVHRDIKPGNILISSDGVAKLTDFGIAQVTPDDRAFRTKTMHALGTSGYMPPEQAMDARGVDHRADIYAIGVTLWTLLTGYRPPGPTLVFDLDRDPRLVENIPEALQMVIRIACSYRREDRFESVLPMIAELAAIIQTLPDVPTDAPKLGTGKAEIVKRREMTGLDEDERVTVMKGGEPVPTRPMLVVLSGGLSQHVEELPSANVEGLDHLTIGPDDDDVEDETRHVGALREGTLYEMGMERPQDEARSVVKGFQSRLFVLIVVLCLIALSLMVAVLQPWKKTTEEVIVPEPSTPTPEAPSFDLTPAVEVTPTPEEVVEVVKVKKAVIASPPEPTPEPIVTSVVGAQASVRVTGDALKVWLVGDVGSFSLPADVPEGVYRVEAVFAGRERTTVARGVVIPQTGQVILSCDSTFEKCVLR